MLNNTSGTTFAGIQYEVPIKLRKDARDHGFVATKQTTANVQLFAHVRDFDLYTTQIKENAAKLTENSHANVQMFQPSPTFFTHTDIYSIVEHNVTQMPYLYVVLNSTKSTYKINNNPCGVNDVASLCTAVGAASLKTDLIKKFNKENGIYHTIHVRTINMQSLKYINANNMSFMIRK